MTKPLFGLFLALVSTAGFAADPRPVTIHLAGDSTMAAKLPGKRPETGWGEPLSAQFRDGSVIVDNRAKNGRSTRTFIEEGRWHDLLQATKAGDVVLIQFGHNDQSVEKPDRYTPPRDYARNLERFVADVRARDAMPVLLTPVARRRFDEAGNVAPSHGDYPDPCARARRPRARGVDRHGAAQFGGAAGERRRRVEGAVSLACARHES